MPSLTITSQRSHSVVTVCVEGELDLATEGDLVAGVIGELEASALDVVIDLTRVSFIDSSGLRALLLCQRAADERSRPLRLTPGTGAVKRLLAISGVEAVFAYT